MSVTTERVADLVAPVAQRLGLRVYDIDTPGGTLRVMLDRDGGIDVDTLAMASEEISRLLDDTEPLAGSYTLEVSSPGLERPLRRPEHFAAAVGSRVKVKLAPGVEGDRRVDGVLEGVDGRHVRIRTDAGERSVALDDVTKAHIVFEWGPAPKPGKGTRPGKGAKPGKGATKQTSRQQPHAQPSTAQTQSTTESSEEHP